MIQRDKEHPIPERRSWIGNIRRGVAASFAIGRRGLHQRWIKAVRCAATRSVNVDGLYRWAFRWDGRGLIDDNFLASRHSLELRVLLDCQGTVIDIALNYSGAIELDAIGT